MEFQFASNELQMLSSCSLRAGFNLAGFVSISVLFTDSKGQIEFMFLMKTSAIISLKTFTMTEAGNILLKTNAKDSFLRPFV